MGNCVAGKLEQPKSLDCDDLVSSSPINKILPPHAAVGADKISVAESKQIDRETVIALPKRRRNDSRQDTETAGFEAKDAIAGDHETKWEEQEACAESHEKCDDAKNVEIEAVVEEATRECETEEQEHKAQNTSDTEVEAVEPKKTVAAENLEAKQVVESHKTKEDARDVVTEDVMKGKEAKKEAENREGSEAESHATKDDAKVVETEVVTKGEEARKEAENHEGSEDVKAESHATKDDAKVVETDVVTKGEEARKEAENREESEDAKGESHATKGDAKIAEI